MLPYFFLSYFIRDLCAICILILLLGAGSKKNESPKMSCSQRAESRLGFPEVSGPPGFSSPPRGPPLLWLPGTVWQSWLQPRAWAGFVLFSHFWGQEGGGPSCS